MARSNGESFWSFRYSHRHNGAKTVCFDSLALDGSDKETRTSRVLFLIDIVIRFESEITSVSYFLECDSEAIFWPGIPLSWSSHSHGNTNFLNKNSQSLFFSLATKDCFDGVAAES